MLEFKTHYIQPIDMYEFQIVIKGKIMMRSARDYKTLVGCEREMQLVKDSMAQQEIPFTQTTDDGHLQ